MSLHVLAASHTFRLFGSQGSLFALDLAFGLYIFFVLSGYLIARPFIHAFLFRAPYPALGPFAVRRFLRIAPTFWVVATGVLVLYGTGTASVGDVAGVYGFAQSFSSEPESIRYYLAPGWSLHPEVVFYALVPCVALAVGLIGRRFNTRERLAVVMGAAGAVFVVSLMLRAGVTPTRTNLRAAHTMMFAFVPGVLLAAIEPFVRARLPRSPAAIWLPRVLLAAAAAALAVHALGGPWKTTPDALLTTAFSAAFVAAPLTRQWASRPAWQALDTRALHWVGERSYSLYLVHAPVLFTLSQHVKPLGQWTSLIVVAGVGVPLSLAGAEICHALVERPFLRLKQRRTLQAPSPAEASPAALSTRYLR